MRNNHSYNWLVGRNQGDSMSAQLAITILKAPSLNLGSWFKHKLVSTNGT